MISETIQLCFLWIRPISIGIELIENTTSYRLNVRGPSSRKQSICVSYTEPLSVTASQGMLQRRIQYVLCFTAAVIYLLLSWRWPSQYKYSVAIYLACDIGLSFNAQRDRTYSACNLQTAALCDSVICKVARVIVSSNSLFIEFSGIILDLYRCTAEQTATWSEEYLQLQW